MRAIIIDPVERSVSEGDIPFDAEFMPTVRGLIGGAPLALHTVPGATAMFVSAVGLFTPEQSFWRTIHDEGPANNVAGVGVMFGIGEDGRLIDVPAAVTPNDLALNILWVGDVISGFDERMRLVDAATGGPAEAGKTAVPVVTRTVLWTPGAVTRAAEPKPDKPKRGRKKTAPAAPDLYDATPASQGAPLAPTQPAPAVPAAEPAPKPPAASPTRVYALRDTDDSRVRMTEYSVGGNGALIEESMMTFPNIESARSYLPPTIKSRVPADDDTEDDALIETWY